MVGLNTSVIESGVLAHLPQLSTLHLGTVLVQLVANLSINHHHALINSNVAESEEQQQHVVLGHPNLLLLDTVQTRAHNAEGEQKQEHVIEQD